MCGIVGYAGGRKAAEIIYEGLLRLEYRGYDSAGIAVLKDGKISTVKRQGRVCALGGYIKDMDGKLGIGHTRWATHGSPSDINAHPHSAGKFTIVHNGIIENYSQLKAEYFDGEKFTSETDSEVVVRLLDKFYDGDLTRALFKVASLLNGSYAVAAVCTDFDGIAVIKNKSPVIIGYGNGGNFIASDAPALAGFCGEISFLKDGDCALLTRDGVSIFDAAMQGVVRERVKNSATNASLDLNGCPHYMLKEIREVPASVVNTCNAYSSAEEKLKSVISGCDRVIIVGCGTAYNSGLIAKRYIEKFARIPAEAEIAGEFRYNRPVLTPTTAVIAVSQSGETADTLEAAKLAYSLGAKVVAVTNAPYSQLTRCAHAVVPVVAGHEICVAATKSYTGQIAALYLIAHTLAGRDIGEASQRLFKISRLCETAIETEGIDSLAHMCARSVGTYFLGRDLDYAVAVEGSLKLREISYIAGGGYPAGELKHGTLALVDENVVAVVIITDKRLADKSMNAVEQVLARGGKVAVISSIAETEKELQGRAQLIKIPDCDENLSPLLSAVAVQLLAYKTAVLLNRDPDKPRNLAKSVTVE